MTQIVLLAITLLLLPIYVFDSGAAQPAHVVLAGFAVLAIVQMRSRFTSVDALLAMLALLVLGREALSVAADPTTLQFLMAGLYIVFNATVAITVARAPLHTDGQWSFMKWAMLASLLVAVAGVFLLSRSFEHRVTGTFNNPNQMGFYAICFASLASLLYLRSRISRGFFFVLLSLTTVLAVVSASRAAAVALAPLVTVGVATLANKRRIGPALLVGAIVVSLIFWVLYIGGALDNLVIMERLHDTGSSRYDNLVVRAYGLRPQTPMEFVFGIGEQVTRNRMPGEHEIHSIFWYFMITYGFIAFLLFAAIVFMWTLTIYRESGLVGVMLVVAPPLLYGLSHNGSRFTPFWILMGLSFIHSRSRVLKLSYRQAQRPPHFPGRQTEAAAGIAIGVPARGGLASGHRF